jgi:hypothetical protein
MGAATQGAASRWNLTRSSELNEVNWTLIWRRLPMRAILAGAAFAAFLITPTLADYYIIQEPTTKRCRIVEERPTSPSVGVVIGPAGFGVRTEAESRMRTVEECHESGTTGGTTVIEERERRPAR